MNKKKAAIGIIVVETILMIVLGLSLGHKQSQVEELLKINQELLDLQASNR